MPLLTIRPEQMNAVFTKYHIEGMPFDAVFHEFTGLDLGHIHDHPFHFTSHVLFGEYTERIYDVTGKSKVITRYEGSTHFVEATTIHEIIGISQAGCWTIITPGPGVRETQFWEFRDGRAFSRQWNESEFIEVKM